MPFSASQVRASLQRNAAKVAGIHELRGLGCADCGGSCGGLGDIQQICDDSGCYDADYTPDVGNSLVPFMTGPYISPVTVQAIPIYNTGSTMPSVAPASGNSAGNAALLSLVNAATTRLAVPQLNPGQSITTLPNGTQVLTQQAAGYPLGAGASALGLSTSGGSTGLLLLLGLGAVLLMGKRS